MPTFESLGLMPKLVQAVTDKGYTEATPIQAKAIPAVLDGRDVMGGSQTGTGKTAAFGLPILQKIFENRIKGTAPRALILAPTRELAAQVEESIYGYSKGLGIYSVAIFGGVKMGPQVSKLKRGVGVVVATPGRLLDHVESRSIDLSKIEFFVLDEADRMLDMGFMPDLKRIIKQLPKARQNLMFSATYSREIRELAESFLDKPLSIEVTTRNTAAERVNQVVHPVERSQKRALLTKLIKDGDWKQVLVFARTRHGAERLSKQLTKGGVRAAAIHGDKSQGQRTRALEEFKQGKVRVLVATDVASRGIDIRALPHVVNFELPEVPEDYVHRIGRTGRAGEEGDAHSLVCEMEAEKLHGIEKLLDQKIPREEIEGFEGDDIDFTPRTGGVKSKKGGRKGGKVVSKPKPKRSPDAEGPRSRRPRSGGSESTSGGGGPKKARPGESTEERRGRKPKWSASRKRAARAQRKAPTKKRSTGGKRPSERRD